VTEDVGSVTGLVPGSFDHRRYVPVVLTRMGERLAMRELTPDVRAACSPLFVVHPVDRDPATDIPKRSVEDHLSKLARALAGDWGAGPAFVDMRYIDTSTPMPDGTHALQWFVQRCLEWGLPLAPTISGAHSPEYRAAAVRAANLVGTSVCLRLGPDEWHDLGTPLGDGRLLGLLAETGRTAAEVHLMLDLQDQVAATPALTAAALRPALRGLPFAPDWASLTVAGTGMPVGTSDIGRDGTAELPRLEWTVWRLLSEPDYRHPSFGDYCVQNPDPISGFNPLFMDSSAQLRYTIGGSWLVVRGRGLKVAGVTQMYDLASQVVAHREFAGADLSWGDGWLAACARRGARPGNQTVWRKVTTNHHLTFVVRQLASLLGSGAAP
jgi:hypothetical protein